MLTDSEFHTVGAATEKERLSSPRLSSPLGMASLYLFYLTMDREEREGVFCLLELVVTNGEAMCVSWVAAWSVLRERDRRLRSATQ